jgi:hypothetical protein
MFEMDGESGAASTERAATEALDQHGHERFFQRLRADRILSATCGEAERRVK